MEFKIMYEPLFENDQTQNIANTSKYDIAHQKWMNRLQTKINSHKTKTILHKVPLHKVSDCVKIYTKLLIELNESQNYKIYAKKNHKSASHKIKVKPTNFFYTQRIATNSLKRWKDFMKMFKKRNPRGMIIKRTNDRSMAEWYKNIIETAFFDHIIDIIEITKIIKKDAVAQFQVIINCEINININSNKGWESWESCETGDFIQ